MVVYSSLRLEPYSLAGADSKRLRLSVRFSRLPVPRHRCADGDQEFRRGPDRPSTSTDAAASGLDGGPSKTLS